MGRVADPKLAAVWRKRVERQAGSGLSVVEYCSREGISTASFYTWKRRLRSRRAAAGTRSNKQVQRQGSQGRSLAGGFVQVRLASSPAIEVCFTDGTTARVPAEHLSATLKVLRTSQSGGAFND